ncbi:MAG: fimbria/pilus periplasmic chaperone [Steroidobacteraceae bacterium]|jgi:fimbrial chaperone protein|nr:fimbria/pilus periplasmic chaperone [Steroidobacteraceae bacterium]
MRARALILAALASATAFGSSPAHAGSFSISPVRVELSSGAATSALTLRNQEATPVVVQAEAMLWEQAEGRDQLTPTRDLLVSPAVFTLPGNGSQLVRVALRREADPGRELSYRLLLTEVPQQSGAGFTGLSVALRLSLPVFVSAAAATGARLEWSAAREADGALSVTARNAGSAHARILNFSVAPAVDGAAAIPQDVTAYVLPGQARTWTLGSLQSGSSPVSDWLRLRVKGTTEAGDFEVETRLAEP